MSGCLECFNSGLEGDSLQIAVDEKFPNFFCEGEQCSMHSPGPVSDDEKLIFLLTDPGSYDRATGVVSPDAFRELTRRDLSVLRLKYTNDGETEATRSKIIARGASRNPPQPRRITEVCVVETKNLRSAQINDQRIFAVYDTALPDSPSHASVFTTTGVLKEQGIKRKRVRMLCHEIFTSSILPYANL